MKNSEGKSNRCGTEKVMKQWNKDVRREREAKIGKMVEEIYKRT